MHKIRKMLTMLSDEAQAALVSLAVSFASLATLLLLYQTTEWNFAWVLAALAGAFFIFLYLFFKFATMAHGTLQLQQPPLQTVEAIAEPIANYEQLDAQTLQNRIELFHILQDLYDGKPLPGEDQMFAKGWKRQVYRAFKQSLQDLKIIIPQGAGKNAIANPHRTFEDVLLQLHDKHLQETGYDDYWRLTIEQIQPRLVPVSVATPQGTLKYDLNLNLKPQLTGKN